MKSPVYFPTPKPLLLFLLYVCLLSRGGISRDSKLIKTQKHIADKRHLGNWFRAALQHARTHPLSSHFVFFLSPWLNSAKGKTKRGREEAFRLSRREIRSAGGAVNCLRRSGWKLRVSYAASCLTLTEWKQKTVDMGIGNLTWNGDTIFSNICTVIHYTASGIFFEDISSFIQQALIRVLLCF